MGTVIRLGAQKESLTLEQCVNIAIQQNPLVLAARQQYQASLARINQAKSFSQPTISWDSDLQRKVFDFKNPGEWYFGVSQPLEFPGKRILRGKIAAKDVGKYLFSANLIIILVFLPLLTLKGIEGAMFRPTAFAVAAALSGSLTLNLTLKPILASYLLTPGHLKERKNPITGFLTEKYHALLKGALEHKKAILIVFVLLIIGAGVLFNFPGKEFVPPWMKARLWRPRLCFRRRLCGSL